MNVLKMLKAFWIEDEGLTMVEYAVAAAVIAVGAYAAFKGLGDAVTTKITNVSTTVAK